MNEHLEKSRIEIEALATCEAEPIRTPGAIQPHGALFAASSDLSCITHVSGNIEAFTQRAPSELLGASVSDLLIPRDEHALRNALSLGSIERQREFLGEFTFGETKVLGAAHLRGAQVIVELSPDHQGHSEPTKGLDRLRWLLARQPDGLSLENALEGMVRNLRAICGFDRVMAYRFRPDGSGEVVAEARSMAIESYLNLRFPSYDIPQIARAIALEQPVRIIADTSATPTDMLAAPDAPELDMTLVEYRGVSPIHMQYLRNMKVGGSLTLPIIVDNALWGLFACHNRTPKIFTLEETMTFDLVGQILNTGVASILRRQAAEQSNQCLRIMQNLSRETSATPDTFFSQKSWDSLSADAMEFFAADGVLMTHEGKLNSAGLLPPDGTLEALRARLAPQSQPGIACADDLRTEDRSDFGEVAGALCMRVGSHDDSGFWLFRAEENQSVTWAGAPKKDIEITANETRLHPRSSFKTYEEMSKGCSRAWEPDDLALAASFQGALRQVVDIQLEREESERSLSLMVQELNHRVRNTISLVRSLTRQSAEGKNSVEDFTAALEVRLLALAGAHELLVSSEFTGLPLDRLFKGELAPFASDRYAISGPPVRLSTSASTIMALVIHEMVTNAVKHGALSGDAGSISITWTHQAGKLRIKWVETGPDLVEAPDTTGFGMFLIEQGLTHQLEGESRVTFTPTGLEIMIDLPEKVLDASPKEKQPGVADTRKPPKLQPIKDLGSVMVLEDDFLIAIEHRTFLLANGAQSVVLASSNEKARKEVERAAPVCAVIDVNLGQEDSLPTAELLTELGVPFIFLTGYASQFEWLKEFPDVPVLKKPVTAEQMLPLLRMVLSKNQEDQT